MLPSRQFGLQEGQAPQRRRFSNLPGVVDLGSRETMLDTYLAAHPAK